MSQQIHRMSELGGDRPALHLTEEETQAHIAIDWASWTSDANRLIFGAVFFSLQHTAVLNTSLAPPFMLCDLTQAFNLSVLGSFVNTGNRSYLPHGVMVRNK